MNIHNMNICWHQEGPLQKSELSPECVTYNNLLTCWPTVCCVHKIHGHNMFNICATSWWLSDMVRSL